jgi:hypothetical protein
VSELIPPRSTQRRHGAEDELPPLDDPYLRGGRRARRPPLSTLALTAMIAPLVGGPLGSVAAIVFGWAARRELAGEGGRRRGAWMATAGMALGLFTTVLWGAAIAFGVWSSGTRGERKAEEGPNVTATAEGAKETALEPVETTPAPAVEEPVRAGIQKETMVHEEGKMTVVDVGASVTSLSHELAKQRAEAARAGQTVVVMTTRGGCEPCQGVSTSLGDPLMQTALANVRLVRVDIDAFEEDLTSLKMPHKRFPGFFLLALDLFPRDAIDGGEWDEDVAENIAPVLGAFVRGKYHARRKEWEPVPESGMRL